jgi:outer membrane protein assembly factor BamB
MKNQRLVFILFLFALIVVSCTNSSPEISQWRGPNRDGIYTETGLLTEWPENGPELLWKFSELGLGFSSPAIVGDEMFINGTLDSISYLFNLDLKGNLKWKKSYGREWMSSYPGVRSSPVIVGEYVYVLSGLGGLYCLNKKDCSLVWDTDLKEKYGAQKTRYGISESLIIDEDILYCTPGGKEQNVIALNRFTGELVWTNKGKGEKSAYCNPLLVTIDGEKFFITMTDKSVLSIKAKTGELAWTHPLEGIKNGAHVATPYYRDGYLFLMDGFEIGVVMLKIAEDGQSATQLWKNELMDETNGHSVVIGNNIYGSAESKKKLICIDWFTGEVKFEIRKFAPSTVIYADGHIYAYTYTGQVGLVQPTENEFIDKGSFKLEKRSELHIMHPVIHNGVLYIRYVNDLMAFNIKKPN